MFLSVLFASLAGADEEADAAAMRTWTSASGSTIEARATGFEEGRLILVTADGRRLGIALSDLSEEDAALGAQLAEEFAEDEDDDSVRIETGPNKLPVFTSGPWRGLHAVYQHNHMDVTVDVDGTVRVYAKHRGQRVGRPLRLTSYYYYTTRHGRTTRRHRRSVAEYEQPPAPSLQPARLTFKGTLRDGVAFEEHMEFSGPAVTFWNRIQDPDGLEQPTRLWLNVGVPPTHTIAPEVPQEERIRLLEGHALHTRPRRGRGTTYTYHDPIRSLGRPVEMWMEGPTWGPRKIHLHAHSREQTLSPYIYAGRCLWQGFRVRFYKSGAAARSGSDGIRFEVK